LEQKKPADKEKGGIKGPVSGPSGSGSSRRRFLSADARPAKKTVSGIESRKTTGGFVEERTVRNSVGTGRPGKAGKRLQGSGQTKEKQEILGVRKKEIRASIRKAGSLIKKIRVRTEKISGKIRLLKRIIHRINITLKVNLQKKDMTVMQRSQ